MDAINRAAEIVGQNVAAFVEAADKLVNLLATEPQGSDQSKMVHQASIDAAYDEYDRARRLLTGQELI